MEYTVKEQEDGTVEWYVGEWLHKENGPARQLPDGTKEWWSNGERHREDGPAIEFADNKKSDNKWFFKGKNVTEDEHADILKSLLQEEEEELQEASGLYSIEDIKDWLADTLLRSDDPDRGLEAYIQSQEKPGLFKQSPASALWLSALTVIIGVLLCAEMYLLYSQ